jgi:YD repeat-containing protein
MKHTPDRSNRAHALSRGLLLLTCLAPLAPVSLWADGTVAPPLLEFASGLPGKQVRLSWASQTGVRYAVEKSTTLASGGVDGWTQVALVEATGPDSVWLDPVATTTKAFYRVSQPLAEVYSISPPVLSPTGGALVIQGQCIPAGSFLVIQIPGQAPVLVPLSALGNGEWQALVGETFAVGDEAAAIRIQDGNGVTLVTLNQPLEITATGRALDSPASLPPGAPVAQSDPIPGVGIVIKQGTIPHPGRLLDAGEAPVSSIGSSGQDGVEVKWRMANGNLGSSGQDGFVGNPASGGWTGLSRKGYDYYQAQSQLNSASIIGAWLGKKGYDYYKAQSDLSSAGLQTNPYYVSSGLAGDMPALSRGHKHPDLMKREMGPGAISPASSGLPGEVSFQFCALALDTPAGPPLQLIHTYRSKPPVSVSGGSGTAGSHWESCYDISIEPIPTTAGSSATRLLVRDGGCRADIFYRQSDGTYRCDGLFREGSFAGDTFTLTFADKGTWTFNPLSDPNAPGRIAAITDRNNVALACVYNGSGRLESVNSQFGQSLTMTYGSDGSLANVSDHSGRSVYYTYCGPQDPDGNEGDLKSISAPQVGSSSPFGPTTFTYLTGEKIPELNGNLLRITDGANRLLEAFTYSTQSDPAAVDFDTCATHDRHRTSYATGGVSGELVTLSFEPLSSGGYAIIENDELGRVTQTTFDRQHREISVREYTGFATPGAFITPTSFPLSGKLYDTDPDFFETTCAYNADSSCTRITRPDGSHELTIYDRDFRRDCSVRQRGNPRVMTLQTAGGELRTMRCDYHPNFGNPECESPGQPIGGLSIKGGRNPGGNIQAQGRKGGMVNGNISVATANRKGWDGSVKGNNRKGWDGSVKGKLARSGGGITAEAIAGFVVAALTGRVDEDCDGKDGDCNDGTKNSHYADADKDGHFNDSAEVAKPQKPIGTKQKAWLCSNFRTRIVSAHGQVSTFGYDANGNCTSYVSPLPSRGQLYQYNAEGQRTTTTVLNGPGSSFTDECVYDPATHFLSSVVSDGSGLALTTSCERDNLGRITRFVDPRDNDWLYSYNPLDQCIQIQSPPVPSRISTNFTVDAGGRVCRCDADYRAPDGSLVSTNPVYSTFFVRDARCRLVQVATEERPVNSPPSALAPAPADLANYDVCDITLDNAGQVTRVSTPAACRGQATDLACDFTYTERGQLHRCIEGGLGTVGAVTTEYGYDLVGAPLRCTTLGDTPADSPQTMFSYDGFHRISSFTDPMGNVETYEYGNDGSVTTSLHGEIDDVPGSTANVLLARCVCKSGFMGPDLLALMKAKEKANRTKCANGLRQVGMGTSPFFEVELEDASFTVERFTPGSTAPPTTEVTIIDCSPAGLVQQIRCNGDVLTNISYDTAGRSNACWNGACSLTVTRNANGQVLVCGETNHFSAGGTPGKTFTVTRVVDALGRCIQTTDGVGNTGYSTYDSLGRCASETEPGGLVVHTAYDGSSSAGAFSSQVSADLDSDGNPDVLSSSLVRCGELVSTTDSHGFPTTFTNDALGRCVRSDSPDGTFESIVFNRQRFVATATLSDGIQCDYTHDLNGQAKTITWSNVPSGVAAVAPKSMQYDGLGNLRSCVQGTSTVTATYDSCGAQTSETQDGLTVSRTFSHRGCTGRTYADGKTFAENRNAFGELVSVSAVTPTGQVISPPVVSMDYMGHQVCRTVQGNGVTTAFTFRADGEASPAGLEDRSFGACVRELITDASSNVLSSKVTTRDSNQRQIRCDTGFSVAGTEKSRITVSYRDLLGNISSSVISRRDSATSPPVEESSVSYTRDLDGTRLTEVRNSVAGAYTKSSILPPGDQQMGQYSTWPGGALTWDANGNMATFQKGTSQLTFVHDAEGRLVSVNNPATGPVITYNYDAYGRRIGRNPQTGGAATRFVYDGSVCIQELGTDNLADMTFACADGIRQCISTRNGSTFYPHASGRSRDKGQTWDFYPRANSGCITGPTGAVVERYDCDDADKPIFLTSEGLPSSSTSSSIGLRWLSPDCAWEPELGMFACPAGIYSPDLGKVVSMSVSEAKPQAPRESKGRAFFNLKPR